MKKRVLIGILFITLIILTGCTKKDKTESTLMKVLSENSKFIYKENSVGVKDGIYVIGNDIILKIGD